MTYVYTGWTSGDAALMRITQKRKIADNIDSCVHKREISKTDNNLVRVYVHKVCPATIGIVRRNRAV